MRASIISALFAMALAVACTKPGPALEDVSKGSALPVDHPPVPDLGLLSANPQRLSVPQLSATYPLLFGTQLDGGAITWMIGNAPGLVLMSDALGNPDFINITAEDRSANPLYLKFADDAARDVCFKGLTADFARTGAARQLLKYAGTTDTVTSNPAAIAANLAYWKLILHGTKVATTDATIAQLTALWSSVYQSASSGSSGLSPGSPSPVFEAWRTVCVAMVTAPEFHIY